MTGRVFSSALAISPETGEATASDPLDHTADLRGTSRTGNISAFGVDRDGELYVISHSRGVVLRLAGAPAAPRNVRIVK